MPLGAWSSGMLIVADWLDCMVVVVLLLLMMVGSLYVYTTATIVPSIVPEYVHT